MQKPYTWVIRSEADYVEWTWIDKPCISAHGSAAKDNLIFHIIKLIVDAAQFWNDIAEIVNLGATRVDTMAAGRKLDVMPMYMDGMRTGVYWNFHYYVKLEGDETRKKPGGT